MSSSNCCFLTCIQVSQEAGQVVWYSQLLQNCPQFIVIHTVEGFGIVNKAEIDIFLEFSCFFDDPEDIDNLISGSSAFSKTSLNLWKFSVNIYQQITSIAQSQVISPQPHDVCIYRLHLKVTYLAECNDCAGTHAGHLPVSLSLKPSPSVPLFIPPSAPPSLCSSLFLHFSLGDLCCSVLALIPWG